jgi:hypothetical protein
MQDYFASAEHGLEHSPPGNFLVRRKIHRKGQSKHSGHSHILSRKRSIRIPVTGTFPSLLKGQKRSPIFPGAHQKKNQGMRKDAPIWPKVREKE